MQSKVVVFLLLAFIHSGCFFIKGKDAELELKKVKNDSKVLKLNGYFYATDTATTSSDNKAVIFFFRNGVFFAPGWFSDQQLDQIDTLLMKDPEKTNYRDIKWMWGLYQVGDSSIVIEKWNPTSGGYATIKMFGEIRNDSTFILTRFLPLYAPDAIEGHIEYKFQALDQKPDSINNFIR